MAPKITEEAKNMRRSVIIEHAMSLFSKKGFVETSMDDIVQVSGISKGGIYNYFKSKEEIFLAIAEERFQQRHSLVESFTSKMSNKEKLTRYLEWTLLGQLEETAKLNARFTFEFWSVMSRSSETSHKAKERYQMFYEDLSSLLQTGIKSGEFREDLDIESTVYILLSNMDGMAFLNSVMDVPMNDKIIEIYINTVLRSILK